MAVLAVLIPPLMLGLVLALGRYEELLLPEPDTDRPAPAAAPTEPGTAPPPAPAPAPVSVGSPASSPRMPAPAIAYDSPQLLDAGLPRV
jgi:hypothetical protein